MLDPHVDGLAGAIEIDTGGGPRLRQAQQLLIQGGVSQGVPPFGGPAYREQLPTQNPEDPKIARLVGFKKVRGQAAAQTGERACSISVIVLMS